MVMWWWNWLWVELLTLAHTHTQCGWGWTQCWTSAPAGSMIMGSIGMGELTWSSKTTARSKRLFLCGDENYFSPAAPMRTLACMCGMSTSEDQKTLSESPPTQDSPVWTTALRLKMKICFYLGNKYDAECLHQPKQSNDLHKRPTIAEQSTWGDSKRDDKPEKDSSQMRPSPPSSSSPSLLKSRRKFSECEALIFTRGPAETPWFCPEDLSPPRGRFVKYSSLCPDCVLTFTCTFSRSTVPTLTRMISYLSSVWIQKYKLLNG